MAGDAVISVRGLWKKYDVFEAVRGIDFEVYEGEVFGLLGPNGAGKTTIVEILEGLRTRTAGEVSVLGFDPDRENMALKDRIGAALQATNLPEKIKVIEAMELFGAFYSRRQDPKPILERLQLWEKRNAFYTTLSGGQKQRLALALALVNDPTLLFLDEPTTGLDPQVRLEIHGLIEELKKSRRTILLTTHYIEEAERLCDRVAIIDEGKIIALGTPRELQARTIGHSVIEIRCSRPIPAELDGDILPAEAGRVTVSEDRTALTINSEKPARAVVEVVKWVDQHGLELDDIHLERPTLEDVFIELTGKRLRD
jgi:ABC-2 type transport system ATP-binding protein